MSRSPPSSSSATRASRNRPPPASSAWKSGVKRWRRPRKSWRSRNRPSRPARFAGWPGRWAAAFTGMCMARFSKWSRKMWAPRALTAPSWWASPPCATASGLCKRKSENTRPRLSAKPSPGTSRPRRIITTAWPPRSTRKCGAPGWWCGRSWESRRARSSARRCRGRR